MPCPAPAFAFGAPFRPSGYARSVHVERLVLPDKVHSFLLHESWLRAYHATVDLLDRMLRDRSLPFSNP